MERKLFYFSSKCQMGTNNFLEFHSIVVSPQKTENCIKQDSIIPQSSFHTSLVTSLANTDRTLHSPDKDSIQTDSPCKSPTEWNTAQRNNQ